MDGDHTLSWFSQCRRFANPAVDVAHFCCFCASTFFNGCFVANAHGPSCCCVSHWDEQVDEGKRQDDQKCENHARQSVESNTKHQAIFAKPSTSIYTTFALRPSSLTASRFTRLILAHNPLSPPSTNLTVTIGQLVCLGKQS